MPAGLSFSAIRRSVSTTRAARSSIRAPTQSPPRCSAACGSPATASSPSCAKRSNMIIKTTWNTGARYTSEGQVITAEMDTDKQRVIFADHSRCICGVLTAPYPSWIDYPDQLRHFVMGEYLHNRYRYDVTGDAMCLRRA